MNSHRWHHADESQRKLWQNPEDVLKEAGLKPGFTFADIGCGQGFFTLPAAQTVGPKGKVYGIDVDESSIQELQKRASAAGLNNIELKTGAAEDTLICAGCVDIAFLGIVLHDFADPAKVLDNARKMIKKGGRLVNLDWKKVAMSFGPPLAIRFSEETASQLIKAAGFEIESISNSGQYHYLIIARPNLVNAT
jgi:ubiquinone/menaquinone biosynthesis C-methylase UbiE